MGEDDSGTVRRRRRRAPGDHPQPAPPAEEVTPRRPRRPRGDGGERAMRDLVGAGPSQLGVSRALRGRDVDRPTAEDIAAAERDLVVVRRHWKPETGPKPDAGLKPETGPKADG